MMVSAELYVRDLPGQLVGSLEPISMVDGNIVGVVHDREQKLNDRILVNVTFEVDNNGQLEELKAIWKSMDILISKIGSVYKTFAMDYLILGKFNAAYMDELIDAAGKAVGIEDVEVSYSASDKSSGKRTAMISAEVRSKEDIEALDSFFEDACKKAGLTLIRGLN
ncbi:ACT-domain-containing protein, predicted allosteric regulator of homoserine dehydrogenase [Thermoplasmatales archaeon BRNA1]|nr:ACT-domain-containing protein, predicted allosteric regulator of homoserine dehydrogenase [Thermoplasmatales archaeon BRNA1]